MQLHDLRQLGSQIRKLAIYKPSDASIDGSGSIGCQSYALADLPTAQAQAATGEPECLEAEQPTSRLSIDLEGVPGFRTGPNAACQSVQQRESLEKHGSADRLVQPQVSFQQSRGSGELSRMPHSDDAMFSSFMKTLDFVDPSEFRFSRSMTINSTYATIS